SRSVRPVGITIGIEIVSIGGMDTVAVLLTARGSSSISDLIHGGRTGGTRTITTVTVTIRTDTDMARTFTTTETITIRAATPIDITTQQSPRHRNDSPNKVITEAKSTASLAAKRVVPSRVTKPITACA